MDDIRVYTTWNDFFEKTLQGHFTLSETYLKGETDIQVYKAVKGNTGTFIEIGYLSPLMLIYLHILNPETPGKNRQQEIEHFYRYEFHDTKQYGPPGLDFNETNVAAINRYLHQGFNGTETVYYRKGKIVKSELTSSYYSDSPAHNMTYRFDNTSLLGRLAEKALLTDDKFDEIRQIDLKTIFSGLT